MSIEEFQEKYFICVVGSSEQYYDLLDKDGKLSLSEKTENKTIVHHRVTVINKLTHECELIIKITSKEIPEDVLPQIIEKFIK